MTRVGWLTGLRRARQAVPRWPRSAPRHRTGRASAARQPASGIRCAASPRSPARSSSNRLSAIRSATHSSTSASIQPTARLPKATGRGKHPRPPARRSCSATGPCAPSPRATAGSGSEGSFSHSSSSRSSSCSSLLSAFSSVSGCYGRRGGSRPPPDAPSRSAMNARTRSAVLSDGERPRSVWGIRFGLLTASFGERRRAQARAPEKRADPRNEPAFQRLHARTLNDHSGDVNGRKSPAFPQRSIPFRPRPRPVCGRCQWRGKTSPW